MKTQLPLGMVRSVLLMTLAAVFATASVPAVSWAAPQTEETDESGFISLFASSSVATESELIAALADTTIPEITLTSDITLTQALTIEREVSIVGAGPDGMVTLTAAAGARHFVIDYTNDAGIVKFTDIAFVGPATPDTSAENGGIRAVRMSGMNTLVLELAKCTFSHNSNYDETGLAPYGGAVALTTGGASLAATDCTFDNNLSSSAAGGAICLSNGSSTATLLRCVFEDNYASNSGGALAAAGAASIQECSFFNNSSDQNGGAVEVSSIEAPLTVIQSTFAYNSSATGGGGIYRFGLMGRATSVLQNSTFVGNSTGSSTTNVAFGGAAYIMDNAVVTNCTVIGNHVATGFSSNGGGGIVFEEGNSYTVEASLLLNNTCGSEAQDLGYATRVSRDYIPINAAPGSIIGLSAGTQLSDYVAVADASAQIQTAHLTHNGGNTHTVMLADASPAIDSYTAGDVTVALPQGQRGIARPYGSAYDAGALEVQQRFAVSFIDWDNTVLNNQLVEYGLSARAPSDPVRSGYTFTGWDTAYDNITDITTTKALYAKNADPVPPSPTPRSGGSSAIPQTGDVQPLLLALTALFVTAGIALLAMRLRRAAKRI